MDGGEIGFFSHKRAVLQKTQIEGIQPNMNQKHAYEARNKIE